MTKLFDSFVMRAELVLCGKALPFFCLGLILLGLAFSPTEPTAAPASAPAITTVALAR